MLGLTFPMALGPIRAIYQSSVPAEMQGRFFAVIQSMNKTIVPVALAITGPLVDVWGTRPLWFVCAAVLLATALSRRFVPALYYIEDQPVLGTQ